MKAEEIVLFHYPKDRLRLTIQGDRSYHTVKPAWASPLSHPRNYLSLLDAKGKEILMIRDPMELSPESRAAVDLELRRRYLTATVTAVTDGRVEFGATYWKVETDRGPKDLVTQNLQENAVWLSDSHLLLLDVDGNRFEIPDISALDEKSQSLINTIL